MKQIELKKRIRSKAKNTAEASAAYVEKQLTLNLFATDACIIKRD